MLITKDTSPIKTLEIDITIICVNADCTTCRLKELKFLLY